MKRFLKHALCILILCIPLLLASCTGEGGEEPITDEQGLIYTLLSDGTYSVSAPNDLTATRVVIPAEMQGRAVTEIAPNAFSAVEKYLDVTDIVIPSSILRIGNGAFTDLDTLKCVYINDLAAWCTIEFGNLFSNPLSYSDELYLDGELLCDLAIPDGVERISAYAFAYFAGISSLTVPDSVTYIGDCAFIGSKGLTLVTVGSGLLSAGSHVFSGCTSITDFICTSDVDLKEGLDLMETVKFNKNSTRVIGHAGLASLATANTREAFLYAARRSYYGIETDIRKTADGHFVCFHDPNLMDYAGLDITVEGSTLAELREVTLFDARKSGTTERGLKIPTLEEYVEICKEYGKECIIELKPRFAREDVIRIVDIVDSLGYLDRSVFISFFDDNLAYVREHRPDVRVALTFSSVKEGLFDKIIASGFDVLISTVIIDREMVDLFHAEGRLVYSYTIDDPARAEELASWGVDFIITNRLE